VWQVGNKTAKSTGRTEWQKQNMEKQKQKQKEIPPKGRQLVKKPVTQLAIYIYWYNVLFCGPRKIRAPVQFSWVELSWAVDSWALFMESSLTFVARRRAFIFCWNSSNRICNLRALSISLLIFRFNGQTYGCVVAEMREPVKNRFIFYPSRENNRKQRKKYKKRKHIRK